MIVAKKIVFNSRSAQHQLKNNFDQSASLTTHQTPSNEGLDKTTELNSLTGLTFTGVSKLTLSVSSESSKIVLIPFQVCCSVDNVAIGRLSLLLAKS